MTMIDHTGSYTRDFETSRAFYDAALAPLGFPRTHDSVAKEDPTFPTRRLSAWGEQHGFWLVESKEHATPRHWAFRAPNREAVQKFYDAALAAGGRDNGAPGVRAHYHPNYFAAFVIDPDGNNVEAVFHGA